MITSLQITAAQRSAVAALDLPFDLGDADIARQFNADGSEISREQRDATKVVRSLARQAMNDQVALAIAA